MPIEAGRVIRWDRVFWVLPATIGLLGCTIQRSSSQSAACHSFVAASFPGELVPMGPEERAQERSGAVLATEAGAGPVGTSSSPSPPHLSAPEAAYARCMQSNPG